MFDDGRGEEKGWGVSNIFAPHPPLSPVQLYVYKKSVEADLRKSPPKRILQAVSVLATEGFCLDKLTAPILLTNQAGKRQQM